MAQLDFPTAPSVGDTYEENNVTYTWSGIYWAANNAELLSDKFVEIAGDNMDGNLTLGGDQITLNATTGSSRFLDGGGQFDVTGGGANYFYMREATSNKGCYLYPEEDTLHFSSQGNDVGSGSGSISLNLNTGAASFANDVETAGVFIADRTTSDATTFAGRLNGSTTTQFYASGAANFAGRVTTDVEDDHPIVSYARGATNDKSAFYARNFNTADTGLNYQGLDSQGNTTFSVLANGASTFESSMKIAPNSGGNIQIYKPKTSEDSSGIQLTSNQYASTVLIQNKGATPSTSDAIAVYKNKTKVWRVSSNGSTTLRSIQINLEPDNPDNYTTDVDEEGNETQTYTGPTLDVKESIETAVAARQAMRETFQELLVAVQSATDFSELKAAMLVALEDYA